MDSAVRQEMLDALRWELRLPDAPTTFTNSVDWLPGAFQVSEFASAACAAALESIAQLSAGAPRALTVDCLQACAAFRSEALIKPLDDRDFTLWDPVSGDYETLDGWIRIHANYPWHKQAALDVLGVEADRAEVEDAVSLWEAEELETEIVERNGCAAEMRPREDWVRMSPAEEPITIHPIVNDPVALEGSDPHLPLKGLRVLDFTRVIAGPECTRVLAAHGAKVARIVKPGFTESPAIQADFGSGKHEVSLDYRVVSRERELLVRHIQSAHVIVVGLRPGALAAQHITDEFIRSINPRIIIASLNAYGVKGPWSFRRGFDSLVQMSGGIAHLGMEASGADRPVPLPAQALDHGAGWLLAAGIARCLAIGSPAVRTSLAAMSDFLWQWPHPAPYSFQPDPGINLAEMVEDSQAGCLRVRLPALSNS